MTKGDDHSRVDTTSEEVVSGNSQSGETPKYKSDSEHTYEIIKISIAVVTLGFVFIQAQNALNIYKTNTQTSLIIHSFDILKYPGTYGRP